MRGLIDFGFGVRLGPLDGKYSAKIREWRNDPAIWKWTRQNDLLTEEGHADWFERQAKDPSIKMYAVLSRESNEAPDRICGVAGLTSIDMLNRRAEFSLYIATNAQGCGLGTWALKTLLSHGFMNLGLHLVWGESFDGNPAITLFKKMGFMDEGVRRDFYFKGGKFIDAHLFGITSEEWAKQCSS